MARSATGERLGLGWRRVPRRCMIDAVIVMKFGGTSVGGAAAIRQVVGVVRSQVAASAVRRAVVVVSAHAGVTDALLDAAHAAAGGGGQDEVEAIVARHRDILAGLDLEPDLLDPLLAELRDLARGLRLVGETTAKVADALLSYGERLSARVVAAALAAAGTAAVAVDAFDAGLRTDAAHGRARPLADDGRIRRYLDKLKGVPVVTGFIAADEQGNITTLGRNGSDYSAALFGVAISAEEIQVWKDVDGVHTADPRLVPDARPIERMSFAEVADLASFGSKVLHPAAMVPAMQAGIPIYVRNTLRPEAAGTRIDAEPDGAPPIVRAVAHRGGVAVVTVRSHRLLPQHDFLARVFGQLAEAQCDVGPVAVGEASIAFAVEQVQVERAQQVLKRLGSVEATLDQALVGVLGMRERLEGGLLADVLRHLGDAEILVRCAGLGPVGTTAAIVVANERAGEAVRLLHAKFLGGR
ncbi:MAG: aspartate kinase [Planctomycetota bacterium]